MKLSLLVTLFWVNSFAKPEVISVLPNALRGDWTSANDIRSVEASFENVFGFDKVMAAYILVLAPKKSLQRDQAIYRKFLMDNSKAMQSLGAEAIRLVIQQEADAEFYQGNFSRAEILFRQLGTQGQGDGREYAEAMRGWSLLNAGHPLKAFQLWRQLADKVRGDFWQSLARGVGTAFVLMPTRTKTDFDFASNISNRNKEAFLEGFARGVKMLPDTAGLNGLASAIDSFFSDEERGQLFEAINPGPEMACALIDLISEKVQILSEAELLKTYRRCASWLANEKIRTSVETRAIRFANYLSGETLRGKARQARIEMHRLLEKWSDKVCEELLRWTMESEPSMFPPSEEVEAACSTARIVVIQPFVSQVIASVSQFEKTPLPDFLLKLSSQLGDWDSVGDLVSTYFSSRDRKLFQEAGLAAVQVWLEKNELEKAKKLLTILLPLNEKLEASHIYLWLEYASKIPKGKEKNSILEVAYRNFDSLRSKVRKFLITQLFRDLETGGIFKDESNTQEWSSEPRQVVRTFFALKSGKILKLTSPSFLSRDLNKLSEIHLKGNLIPAKEAIKGMTQWVKRYSVLTKTLKKHQWQFQTTAQAASQSVKQFCSRALDYMDSLDESKVPEEVKDRVVTTFEKCKKSPEIVQQTGTV